jgi:tricarballylate dehydrogenase
MNTDWDVVVVGAGNAALCAAIAAREQGARVLVLEKGAREERGGNSYFTDGAIRFAYRGLQDLRSVMPWMDDDEASRIEVSPYPSEAFLDDLVRMSNGKADQRLAGLLADRSLETIRWMVGQGVRFTPIYDNQAFEEEGRHRFWGGLVLRTEGRGIGLTGQLFERCERLGVEVWYGSPATDLLVMDDRVVGVRVGTGEGARSLSVGAVVLACGGFEANREWREEHLGPEWDGAIVRGTGCNTGDGLRMAMEAGARRWGDWSGCHAVAMDVGAPDTGDFATPGDVYKKHSYPLGIIVNRDGARFVDEGADYRNYTYARYGRELLIQPGSIGYHIFDGQVAHLLRSEYSGEYATRFESDTLAGLAAQLDVDTEAFLATVADYNAHVEGGEFRPHLLDGKAATGITPPKSNWALRIERPPFLAFPVRCGITFTFGGVLVDERARVLRDENAPIPGLHAAGEMVGGLFHDNYPGGAGLMSGAVFGRLAGVHAAEFALADRRTESGVER